MVFVVCRPIACRDPCAPARVRGQRWEQAPSGDTQSIDAMGSTPGTQTAGDARRQQLHGACNGRARQEGAFQWKQVAVTGSLCPRWRANQGRCFPIGKEGPV
jgi:hypothetical protein